MSSLTEKEIEGMKMSVAADLVALLAERRNLSFPEAMDTVVRSWTFSKLLDTETGLYFQSPGYVYSFLEDELGK